MRVQYQGPIDRVSVPVPGTRKEIEVRRGETVEVPDELGADLIRQGVWIKRPPAPTRAAGEAPTADEAKKKEED